MEIDNNGVSEPASGQGCIFNYVVTAYKASSVIKSVVGSFTSPTDVNLIIAKSTKVEVHKLTLAGLQLVMELPIYGRISAVELFRPKGKYQDNLFILVEKYKVCVLEFDPHTKSVVTRAHGDVRDNIGSPSENGQLAALDPEGRAIAMHLYCGLIKVIPLGDRGRLLDAFNARIEELNIIDMIFLTGQERPTIAVLYEDLKKARHMKTYVMADAEKDLTEGPWSHQNLDPGSGMLLAVPQPLGGVIVVGESLVSYLSFGSQTLRAAPIKPTSITAVGRIDADGSRYLLSDYLGNLYLMVLAHDRVTALGIKIEILGQTCIARSLSYLDDGVVFVGSRTGDSQLIKLHAKFVPGSDPPSSVEVLDSYTNLGPIVDFCVVDPEGQGQGQVVTCSGVMGDGSLRVVRNGIGINEQASVELPAIKGLWSLRSHWADAHDRLLVLTFVGKTRILAINDENELEEAEGISGFDTEAQSFYCGNTRYDQLVQVTSTAVLLLDSEGTIVLSTWRPSDGLTINIAAGGPGQVLVATGGGHLISLVITEDGNLVEKGRMELGSEIACVDIHCESDKKWSNLAAIGTWDMRLHLLSLPGLTSIGTEEIGGEVIPRSVLIHDFDGNMPYCLMGLGDGQLLSWRLTAASEDAATLSDRKRILLGTKPVLLRTFKSNGATNVFAGSDRPTIIYTNNKKLLFSNLNESEVHLMASFNSVSFPDSLAIAKASALTIGTVEEIQKLHVRTVPLREQPRRIVHQDSNKIFGLITIAGNSVDEEAGFIKVVDDQTFDILAVYPLDPSEMGCSIASVSFGGGENSTLGASSGSNANIASTSTSSQHAHHSHDSSSTPYLVVGTAYVRPEDPEPSKGRLLVLQYHAEERRLSLVTERDVKGAVYQVLPFQNKLLNSCNNKVQLHKMVTSADGSKELRPDCSHHGNILALHLATRGDFILVGDLMRSVSLLMYKQEEETLELRAQEFNTNWTSAISMLDDDTFIAAENGCNLYVVRKNPDATTDEERARLEVVGEYHVGEFVNTIRRGSLVMKLPDSEVASFPTFLFGTTEGSLGLMASLPPSWFEFMSNVQDATRKIVRGVGGWDHTSFRAFSNERRSATEARGFVDGDLVESFLDLPREKQELIAAVMPKAEAGGAGTSAGSSVMTAVSVEEIVKRVEELAQGLH
ncbi:hypothetical protein CEUSTIGMA_g10688.t1 [Chlamydomonas eustigma]|uniref:DNA damage-binding protein 1 n=1 Tax=Chlamydomonas eustigma TaxID=1157962 RepID=A0A250XK18_9CHLO|nr:hypothetical protein CEUSTIGMA_g10688.t1 [Chlamydomonas eustigma]|eukprot:GAX83262.1 hypothetical protein CEUSTIGMA_g10688.t1 [Chlamydomonas eustigma]